MSDINVPNPESKRFQIYFNSRQPELATMEGWPTFEMAELYIPSLEAMHPELKGSFYVWPFKTAEPADAK